MAENSNKRSNFFKIKDTPGPGTYQIPSLITDGPSFSISRKFESKSLKIFPGPGQYDPIPYKIPTYIIGKSKREYNISDSIKSQLPGPGTYTIPHKYLGTSWKFVKPKTKTKKNLSDVGPGSYEQPSTLDKRSCSIGTRPGSQLDLSRSFPGPGSYKPEMAKSQSSIVIGSSKRPEIKNNNIPGPGSYEIKPRPTTSAKFGTGKRTDIYKKIECRSTYDIPTTIGEGPKISLHARLNNKIKIPTPGPGAYSPEKDLSIPGFLFGSSKKEIMLGSESFGASMYNIQAPSSTPKWKFGSERRKSIAIDNKIPGPGSYEKGGTFEKPKITFKAKLKDLNDKYIKSVPGPGTYNQTVKDFTPSWSVPKADRGVALTKPQKESLMGKIDSKNILNISNPNLRKNDPKNNNKVLI
jgi:Sperm-tail PG-rich repeat